METQNQDKFVSGRIFHYLITGSNTWGRGETVQEAFQNASMPWNERKVHCILHSVVLAHDTTDEELAQLRTFWVVDDFGSLVMASDCTDADHALIKLRVLGWTLTHYNKKQRYKVNKVDSDRNGEVGRFVGYKVKRDDLLRIEFKDGHVGTYHRDFLLSV